MFKQTGRLSPMATRAHVAVLLAAPLLGALAGCVEEETKVLPTIYNEVRNRSVRIDASKLLLKSGSTLDAATLKLDKLVDYTGDCKGTNCSEFKPVVTDGIKVSSMMGIGGTAKNAIASDDVNPALFTQSVKSLYAPAMRIPTGYGCKAMMQGLFPDKAKDVAAIDNYDLKALDELIGATRSTVAYPVWTVGYDLGTGVTSCVYENGEVKGTPIADVDKWAKAAVRIAKWYDFDLPNKKKDEKNGDPLCRSTDKNIVKPWYCSHSIVDIEFLRDPFGAGGYKKEDKAKWLAAYKAFALAMRANDAFFLPDNQVKLIAPSVVLRSDLELQDPTSPNRSPIYDFIDFVVDPKNGLNNVRLPLSALSIEIEASTPTEARTLVKRVAEYAATKKLLHEKGLFGSDGTAPIPIWVMDLRIKSPLSAAVLPLADPKSPSYDLQRLASWRGGFVTAVKILWQGLVTDATIGSVVRFPTVDPTTADTISLAATARESDYLWFSQSKIQPGALKPSAWPGFWFHGDHMGGEQLVSVQHGPDALGMSSKQATDPDEGIVAMATRTSCVNANREAVACVADASDTPSNATFYTKGKRNILRILVTDFQIEVRNGKEILEHKLRVQVDGLPIDAKVAGYKLGWMDGTAPTWAEILYREQGFADITNGSLSFTRVVPVPSVQYIELYF